MKKGEGKKDTGKKNKYFIRTREMMERLKEKRRKGKRFGNYTVF